MPFDPFGRLFAEPKPDPDIMNFKNPFRLGNSVGMEGLNSRRDVAKVESLLGRANALDLSKTDGVTGFFGARTDDAVKKFQKDRGLKVDGLITPNGPTLRTLIANQDTPKNPKPPTAPKVPKLKNPTPPKRPKVPNIPPEQIEKKAKERGITKEQLLQELQEQRIQQLRQLLEILQ